MLDKNHLETLNITQQVLRHLMLSIAGACQANLGNLGVLLEAGASNERLDPLARQMLAGLAAGAIGLHATGIRKN